MYWGIPNCEPGPDKPNWAAARAEIPSTRKAAAPVANDVILDADMETS
jgi:hypothetical protein